jgi:lysophospholipase L1-like esterase
MVAVLLVGEVMLRFLLPPQDRFFVWPPNFRVTLHPDPTLIPGIDGTALFSTNSDGMRGDELPRDRSELILAVGGSTTECLYLDDTEAWPYLLQKKLTESKRTPVWVGNVGRAGRNSRDHLLQLKYLLPQYPQIKTVIVLVGSNDLHIRISDRNYDPQTTLKPAFENTYMRRAFAMAPSDKPPYHYTRLGWWRVVKKFKNLYLDKASDAPFMDSTGGSFASWRQFRKNAEEVIDDVPDLASALEEFRRNLNAIAGIARERGVRLILITQPTIWRADLPQEEMDLLWGGGVDKFQLGLGKKYYSPTSLANSMRQYNDVTLDVCRAQAIDCIDLAGALPKDRTVFYDDVHFNESGARQVADVLFKYIDQRILPD